MDKRINALDTQSTRLTDLYIAVDKASGFTAAKKILASVLAPLISELSGAAVTNRATTYMKVNEAGGEWKCTVDDIYTLISDLSAITSLESTDLLRSSRAGIERKITYANFVTDLVAVTSFVNAVNALITSGISAGIAAESETLSNVLAYDGQDYGQLQLKRRGKLVCGYWLPTGDTLLDLRTMTNTGGASYSLPETMRPSMVLSSSMPFHSEALGTEDNRKNHFIIDFIGGIKCCIKYVTPAEEAAVAICYFTA
jgi:hypothetical protein